MNQKRLLLALAQLTAMFIIVSLAKADKLCAKKTVEVSRHQTINLANSLTVAPRCPVGYVEVLNTATFKGDKGGMGPTGPQGPKGDTGADGSQGVKGDKGDAGDPVLSTSTCQKRLFQFSTIINDSNRGLPDITGSCLPGEYAH